MYKLNNYSSAYVKEVSGKGHFEDLSTRNATLVFTASFSNIIRIPYVGSCGFEIDYVLEGTVYNQMRRGKMTISVDTNTDTVRLVDDYNYVGATGEETNIIFTASADPSTGCVIIQYKNTKSGNTSSLTYTCRSIS